MTTICIKRTTNFLFNDHSFTNVFFNIHRIVKCRLNDVNVKIVNQNMRNVIHRFKKKNQKIREKYDLNFQLFDKFKINIVIFLQKIRKMKILNTFFLFEMLTKTKNLKFILKKYDNNQ